MGILGDIKGYLAEKLDLHITSARRSRKQLIKNKVKLKDDAKFEQNIHIYNLNASTPDEQKQVLALLKDGFDKGEVLFVDDESRRLASGVEAAEGDSENGALVAYFEDKLHPTDWQIFRTGLYINYLLEQGMPTSEIRRTVIQTYGTRGRNILNLASAGHFATHIKPLYEELAKSPGFSQRLFYEEFERILIEMPFAIFVNTAISASSLCRMVQDRVQQAKKYSVQQRKVYIHGWGGHVKTVEECLDMLDASLKIVSNKRKEVVETIDVTIEF